MSVLVRHAFVSACWGVLLAAGLVQAQTFRQYGQECAQKVTPIPAFSCMQGEVIPITVNGKKPEKYTAQMTCDKPSLLVAPGAEKSDGQCVPYSRALVLRDDAVAQVSAICRQKKIRPEGSYLFDEIDIVAHNVRTGSTCWFQALAPDSPLRVDTGIDGRNVPSPTEVKGQKVWNAPSKTAMSQCVHCHDSGPFMYSPFIAQTSALPGDPLGKYKNDVGAAFKAWPKPFGITTRGNTCTTCHHIGNMNSCNVAMAQSIGKADNPGANEWAKKFPQSHWMSPGNLHSQVQWDTAFADSVRLLAACCKDPKGAQCQSVDYQTTKKTR